MGTHFHKLRSAQLVVAGLRDRALRLSARRAVVVLAALFLLLLTAGDALLLSLEYDRRLEEVTQSAANLTVVLEKYVRQTYQHLDALLLNMTATNASAPGHAAGSPFAFAFRPTALVSDLRVYDQMGRLKTSSTTPDAAARDWSLNEGFLKHKSDPSLSPFVGLPFREGNAWRHPYSQRITGPNGAFAGMAVVLVDMDAFASFLRSIEIGLNGSVAIIRRDGEYIARYPQNPGAAGDSVVRGLTFQDRIAPLAKSMISGNVSVEGATWIGHFRSVDGLPLVVAVFMDQADALAPWRSLMRLHAGIVGAVALAVALLVALIGRQQVNLARVGAEMREEQRRLEAITAHLPAALLQRTRDVEGTIHYPYVSAGAGAVLGMPREEFMANPKLFVERLPPVNRTRLQAAWKLSGENLSDLNEEFRIIEPGGEERWLRASARARRQDNGTTVWDALVVDVTAHKSAMADKRALERRLEAIVGNVPGVVFQRVQRHDGTIRYTFISPSVETLFGITAPEVMRDYRVLGARATPEDPVGLEESFNRQDSHHAEWSKEFRVTGADRQERWVRGTATRHRLEETGELVWDGILLDVTMQKAAVAAMRALQRRMEAIVANTPGVVFECIQNGQGTRFSFISPQIERIFHIPIREALHDFNQIYADIVPEDRPVLEHQFALHYQNLEDWIQEFRIQPKGQPLQWIRSTARARRQEDGSVVWNGVFQDITQSKNVEEQAQRAQRNEALAHLTAGVAHEFNNLLTVIVGNLELMEVEPTAIAELIPPTQRAAERGARVTRALQAYSRRQSLRPRTGRFCDMLQEVIVLLHSILGQYVQLDLHFSEDTWPIHVDWDLLGNSLIALAMKGKEAMPRGGVLRIQTHNETLAESQGDVPAGDYVRLSVTDGGQALPEEVRRHAFDPFYSATALGGGMDLGLSTVFGFVRQSLGHVSLDSHEGQGTTVAILLPRAIMPNISGTEGIA